MGPSVTDTPLTSICKTVVSLWAEFPILKFLQQDPPLPLPPVFATVLTHSFRVRLNKNKMGV